MRYSMLQWDRRGADLCGWGVPTSRTIPIPHHERESGAGLSREECWSQTNRMTRGEKTKKGEKKSQNC